MKIRNRLTLSFSLTAMTLLLVLGGLVYYFTADFHEREFYERLEERVQLAEQIFLEQNEAISQAVRDKFLQRLDMEEEYAITLKPSGQDSLSKLFYPGLAKEIASQKLVRFCLGNRQGVARVYDLPKGRYVVVVTAIDLFGNTKLAFLKQILLAGGMLALAFLILVAWLTSRQALKPLEEKIGKASRISANSLDLRLKVANPDDEIGELAIAFNRMLDRLQSAFLAQRHFVSNASHELRNPLTAIIGEAEVALNRERTGEEYRSTLRSIVSEAERLHLLTKQLLELSRAESMDAISSPTTLPLVSLLVEVLERFPVERLVLELEQDKSEAMVKCNPPLLQTAISNIVDNALKYSDNELVTISFSEVGSNYEISVTDHGIGISSDDLKQIYVPMFRAQNARKLRGHGFGLPLARRIVHLHGGTLEVSSDGQGLGTKAVISLPKAVLATQNLISF